jgi:hypothetical protein
MSENIKNKNTEAVENNVENKEAEKVADKAVENAVEGTVEKNELQTTENSELQPTKPVEVVDSPVRKFAEAKLKELQELNPGLKLDFLNVFTRLKLNTKGQFFYELSDEEFNLSDAIDVQIIAGEQMYQLWDSDENTLICYSSDQVTNAEGTPCAECPHDNSQCKLRYALVFKLIDENEDEDVYNLSLPTTGTLAFGDYIKLMKKKFNKSAQKVVTTVFTKEKSSKEDSSRKYNSIQFKFKGDLPV